MVTILSIIRLSSWRYVLSWHPFVYPPSSQTNWHDDEVMLFGNVIGRWLSFLIRGHSWLRDYPRFTFCKPWGMLLVTQRWQEILRYTLMECICTVAPVERSLYIPLFEGRIFFFLCLQVSTSFSLRRSCSAFAIDIFLRSSVASSSKAFFCLNKF